MYLSFTQNIFEDIHYFRPLIQCVYVKFESTGVELFLKLKGTVIAKGWMLLWQFPVGSIAFISEKFYNEFEIVF